MKNMFEGWSIERAEEALEEAKARQKTSGVTNMLYRQALAKYIREQRETRRD